MVALPRQSIVASAPRVWLTNCSSQIASRPFCWLSRPVEMIGKLLPIAGSSTSPVKLRRPRNAWAASTRRSKRARSMVLIRPLRVAALKAGRDKVAEALDYAKKSSTSPIEIDPIAIDRFTRLMREQLTSGDVAARKAYLSSVVDAFIVSDDNIRSTFGPEGQPTPRVRKSVQEWCAIQNRTTNSYAIEITIQFMEARLSLPRQAHQPLTQCAPASSRRER